MKKWISWILALSLLLGAAVIPAVAEETNTENDAVSSASVNTGSKGGQKNAPNEQMPNGQMPNGRGHGNGGRKQQPGNIQVQPQMPSAATPDTATPPEMPGQANGEAAEISENPENTQPADSTGNSGSTESRNRKKDKDAARDGKKGKKGTQTSVQGITFELLLEKGVITQEVYDAIMNFIKEYTTQSTTVTTVPSEDVSNG